MKSKVLYAILGCLFMYLSAFSQDPNPPKTDDEIVTIPDIEAEFPGGIRALIQYIDENLIHPVKVLSENAAGRTAIRFVIKKDGSISNVSVVKGMPNCKECDEEAKKVIKNMPKWTPAYKFTQTKQVHILDDSSHVFTTPADHRSTEISIKADTSHKIPVRSPC